MAELLERGCSDRTIGRALGCTPVAVSIARKRHGLPSRTRVLMSATTIAREMGFACAKGVARWLEQGWIRGRRGQVRGPHRQWYVRREAWLAFLEDPAYWYAWDPERLRDPEIRAWARALRTDRYLTIGQVAARFSVCASAVNDWIHRGLLPAVAKYPNWIVRERDLEGFVPPCERPKQGFRKQLYTPAEDVLITAAAAAGEVLTEVAEALGRNKTSVYSRLYRLREMGAA